VSSLLLGSLDVELALELGLEVVTELGLEVGLIVDSGLLELGPDVGSELFERLAVLELGAPVGVRVGVRVGVSVFEGAGVAFVGYCVIVYFKKVRLSVLCCSLRLNSALWKPINAVPGAKVGRSVGLLGLLDVVEV
jgi:hypothetical protein